MIPKSPRMSLRDRRRRLVLTCKPCSEASTPKHHLSHNRNLNSHKTLLLLNHPLSSPLSLLGTEKEQHLL
jgi:hypothetical protein